MRRFVKDKFFSNFWAEQLSNGQRCDFLYDVQTYSKLKVVSNNTKIYFWLSLLAETLSITQKLDNLKAKL